MCAEAPVGQERVSCPGAGDVMSLDVRYSAPKMNAWFEHNIVHTGHARAEFTNPAGTIEAPAEVRVDDSGAVTVRLTAKEVLAPEGSVPGSVYEFLHGVQPPSPKGLVVIEGFDRNTCEKLIVTTHGGVYASHGRVLYSMRGELPQLDVVDVTFRPRAAEFSVREAGTPYYGVLPLCNLLSDFIERSRYEGFDAHPLRFRQVPDVPSHLSPKERELAVLLYRATTPIMGFPCNGAPAFVEPLPEYEAAKKALLQDGISHAITAVMVLTTSDEIPQADTIGSWPPLALVPVLMLGENRRIGVPWIETRDEQGNLVRRLHVSIRCFPFARWQEEARSNLRGTVSKLLASAQSTGDLSDPRLWVAIRNLTESRNDELALEEQLVHICRGIEALVNRGPRGGSSLLSDISPERASEVSKVIDTARLDIERLAREATEQGAPDDSETLQIVVNKLRSNAPFRDAHFGRIVLRLLDQHSLLDGEVLKCVWPGGLAAWLKTTRDCRDTPMHGGYFDFSERVEDLHTRAEIAHHLADILLRSLLKELNYEGDYESACIGVSSLVGVNRVQADTPLKELGYDPDAWM